MAVEQEPAALAEDHLAHYGVKGMRWGVVKDHVFNRQSHADAAAGAMKVKIGSQHEKNRDAIKSKRLLDLNPSKDHVEANFVKKKAKISGVHTLSNQDLNVLIGRMNLEVQYKSLKTVQHEQSILGKGKRAVGHFLGRVGGDIVTNVVTSWLKRPGSRSPTHARSWVGNQPVIQGSVVQKSIGS